MNKADQRQFNPGTGARAFALATPVRLELTTTQITWPFVPVDTGSFYGRSDARRIRCQAATLVKSGIGRQGEVAILSPSVTPTLHQ